jgi:hypothetical protein
MDDYTIKGWNDLIQQLYDIPQTSFGRHRSDFVYRGLADETWQLETSLSRMGGDYHKIERPMLRSFVKYAEQGSLPHGNLWLRLAVAQHHGLPTRLLDWTVSPQVAVHFATAEEEHYDKDGVVWCIDVVEARRMLPPDLLQALHAEYAYLFSVEMLENIKTLEEFDSFGGEDKFVLFFEPPSLDARIINQWGIVSVMPGARLSLRDFLEAHPKLYRRIVIPKECKWEIRDKLDQGNVTERMLFPGLDGLSRWLRRYYGSGPGLSGAPRGDG